jgi:hypothetical protein
MVEGQLDLSCITVRGRLSMYGLRVGQNLFMRSAIFEEEVDLNNAMVEGQLDLSCITVRGRLSMNDLKLGQNLFMGSASETSARFEKVDLISAHLRGSLFLSGAKLKTVDLSATRIEGELQLGSSKESAPLWDEEGAWLNLHNAHAGTLQDWAAEDPKTKHWQSSWPSRLQLEGFTYDRLGQFGTEAGDEMLHRKFTWYLDWLTRDASPQPYEQLAATFRKAGDPTRADDVLYAGRERVRKSAWRRGSRLRWLGLSVLKWTIGYGIGLRYFLFPLRWVLGLAALSTGVLLATGQPLTCESAGAPKSCPMASFPKWQRDSSTA